MSREYVMPSVAVFQEFTVVQPAAGRPNRNGDIFPPQTLREAITLTDGLMAENQVMRDHIDRGVELFINSLGVPPTVFRGDDAQAGSINRLMLATALRLIRQGQINAGHVILGRVVDEECKIAGELHNVSEHLFYVEAKLWN